MKKIFTLVTCLFMMGSAMATDYTDTLSMNIQDLGEFESSTTVSVESTSDGYNITLNDFSFSGLVIGDVTVSNLGATVVGDYTFFEENTQIAPIENGGELAAAVGNQVTVSIKDGSVMSDDKLYLDLEVVVNMMGTDINVTAVFGEEFVSKYTGLMTIDLGVGDPTEQDATILLAKADEKYTLTLVDFSFSGITLGDISVADLENTATEDGTVTLTYDGNITTTIGEFPATVEVNVSSAGVMTTNITISVLGMSVKVTFDSSVTTGISKVNTTDNESPVVGIYNLQGQKVTDTNRSGIYILRKADGTATKKYVR